MAAAFTLANLFIMIHKCLSVSFYFLLLFLQGWENDIEIAKRRAMLENKLILVEFSGSDWCGPCIRLRKEIFETREFKQFADSSLVLLNADFPRLKKNQLSKEQQKKNDQLAEDYNPEGIFPKTMLLTPGGKVIRTWDGYPNLALDQFINQLKSPPDARH